MKIFNTISMKIIITSGVILLVALLVCMFVSIHYSENSIRDFAKDELQLTAEKNSEHIAKFFDDKTRLGQAVSEEPLIIQFTQEQVGDLRGPNPNDTFANYVSDETWEQTSIYLNRMWSYWQDELENLFVGDIYGYAHLGAFEVIDIPTAGIPMNFEGRGGNYWRRAVEGSIAYGDLEQSPVPGHDFLASAIAVPVKDDKGVTGLVGVAIDFRPVDTYVSENTIGDSGYSIVLDRYGRILVHPNAEYCLHGVAPDVVETYLKDIEGTGWDELANKMGAGESGFTTVNADGKKYHVYYDYVAPRGQYTGMELSVASIVSESELFEEANSMRNAIIILIIVTLVVSILATFIVTRRITNPIKQLTKAADKLSQGDFSVDVKVKSKDEVGDLANSFSRMVTAYRFMAQDQEEQDK